MNIFNVRTTRVIAAGQDAVMKRIWGSLVRRIGGLIDPLMSGTSHGAIF
jgi:hypothetical protein